MAGQGVPAHFGRYRIDGLVSRGGMGVVYRATDTGLERTVALKVIAPEVAADPASASASCTSRGSRRRWTTPT